MLYFIFFIEDMLSKNRIKFIHSLALKKNRTSSGLFVAEGPKLVGDLLGTFDCEYIVASRSWIEANAGLLKNVKECDEAESEQLHKVSFLETPQDVVAVFRQPKYDCNPKECVKQNLCLALDDVQNPGNLGTIVRLADWFGIEDVFCSLKTADIYNPKTVQATMGAMARVRVHYVDLCGVIADLPKDVPVYGTFLDGEYIYETDLKQTGLIVMGNEGNGISESVASLVTDRLYIPNFPPGRETSESLNVAIATAVVCSEFRRRQLTAH